MNNDKKTPVNDKKTPVNDEKTPVNDEKTSVNDEKTSVNDEKTSVNEKKDTMQNTEYQNLLTDFGFKFVFKQERFLIPFLNELLQGREKIKKVTILDSEFLGKTKEDRKAVFDIYCENENDEKFLIEMQNLHQYYFLDRSLFYSSFLIQRQGKKGKWNFKLKAMYVIGILNFVPKEMRETDEYLYRILLKDDKTGITAFDKLKFIFVSLPKFIKTEPELRTPLDYWLYMPQNKHL
ncbi:MAG: Rpn family recombination-promoting nuclease/putative transposase [Bacteroidales bacterium]|jgi:predicted transposase/invertase (TIGR01784 family)|nr:Rpn family recombination-promoting nuclease/putative transposase [Bacteroidales bacterium]